MLRQYSIFFINGILIGIITWGLQYYLYGQFGGGTSLGYAIATLLSFSLMLVVNFFIQKHLIFKRYGYFLRYILADIFILILVTLLAPLCRLGVAVFFNVGLGDKFGFILAALITSFPSFYIRKKWVFRDA